MFFTFNQNNSGGTFTFDEEAGITHFVIIEAQSARVAKALAEDKGLYFDGCRSGRDCSCCGDRWHEPCGDGSAVPEVYGQQVGVDMPFFSDLGRGWMKDSKEGCIHYLDGRKEWFGYTNKKEAMT